jgi:GTP-binding protein
MSFTLAIVGRPNVGKSTLFNRLVGRKLALVDDQPGVTRDLREGEARLGALRFTILDTAGLEDATDDSLQGRMRRLSERAVEMADASLFLIDARAGVTANDRVFAEILRRSGRPVILAANKAEGQAADAGLIEAWELGLGEPLALSAEHGEGMAELAVRLTPMIEAAEEDRDEPETDVDVEEDDPGRPARSPPPAPCASPWWAAQRGQVHAHQPHPRGGPPADRARGRDHPRCHRRAADWDGTPMRIFDTAGMRKRAKVQEKLEKLSVADGLRAVKFAEVVVVLLDAAIPFETQDLRIADLAEREGAPWSSPSTSGTWSRETGKAPRPASRVRNAPAAAQGRAARDRVGGDRQGARPAPRRDPEGP